MPPMRQLPRRSRRRGASRGARPTARRCTSCPSQSARSTTPLHATHASPPRPPEAGRGRTRPARRKRGPRRHARGRTCARFSASCHPASCRRRATRCLRRSWRRPQSPRDSQRPRPDPLRAAAAPVLRRRCRWWCRLQMVDYQPPAPARSSTAGFAPRSHPAYRPCPRWSSAPAQLRRWGSAPRPSARPSPPCPSVPTAAPAPPSASWPDLPRHLRRRQPRPRWRPSRSRESWDPARPCP
mmetsp:Transcript_79303/g.206899  ORF Transcript_79303/g.206899 Transcript_79303/m.206899 type:complete len:240 (-) Transcript_79303:251-970(-)